MVALAVVLLARGSLRAAQEGHGARGAQRLLPQTVEEYDNGGSALIPTLLDIASRYHLPMGIECVTPEAMDHPVTLKAVRTTVGGLLSLAVEKSPGFGWVHEEGAVVIGCEDERGLADNMFSRKLPTVKLSRANVNGLNEWLRNAASTLAAPSVTTKGRNEAGGMPSSFPGIGDETAGLDIYWPAGLTLRQALCRAVRLYPGSTGLVWIATLPPDKLYRVPGSGLWILTSPANAGDLKHLLPAISR